MCECVNVCVCACVCVCKTFIQLSGTKKEMHEEVPMQSLLSKHLQSFHNLMNGTFRVKSVLTPGCSKVLLAKIRNYPHCHHILIIEVISRHKT